MKLKNIAKTIILEQGRTREITDEIAVQLLKNNCKQFDPNNHGPILRGLKNKFFQFGFTNPSKFKRTSANTKNYYTLLIDNSPLWRNFPKRSKSIICTTSPTVAGAYGTMYWVVPFDESKIGIAPDSDMWYSFSGNMPYDSYNLGGFNKDLEDIAKNFDLKLDDDNYRMFISDLEDIGSYIQHDPEKALRKTATWQHSIINDFLESGADSMVEWIEDIFNPKKNGFKIVKWPSKLPDTKHEVWTDGPCVLIEDGWEDMIFERVYENYR